MSGHAAVSVYGRLTGDPRAIETRTGNPMTVGRLAVSLPCRDHGEDGEATAFLWLAGVRRVGRIPGPASQGRQGRNRPARTTRTRPGGTNYR